MVNIKAHTRKTKKGQIRVKAHTRKSFLTYHGEGYVKTGTNAVVGIGKFSEEEGYSPNDIATIKKMKVGQEIDLSDFSGIHTIRRLKNDRLIK